MKSHAKLCLAIMLAAGMAAPALAQKQADRAEKIAEGIVKLQGGIQQAKDQLTSVVTSMNAMADGTGDLKMEFTTFSKEVDRLEKMSADVKKKGESARAKRDQYLKTWEAESGKIQNEQLKQAATARRAELEPIITGIKDSATSAGTTFTPFMQDLKDLKLFLGNDLSQSGLTAAADLFKKCTDDAAKVQADLDKTIEGLGQLAARFQPAGGKA